MAMCERRVRRCLPSVSTRPSHSRSAIACSSARSFSICSIGRISERRTPTSTPTLSAGFCRAIPGASSSSPSNFISNMKRRQMLFLAGNLAFASNTDSGWIKSARNPMLTLGAGDDFDSQNIMSPAIVKEGGQYYLFYAGGPVGPRNGSDLIKYQLGLALSRDGETWKKTGKPLLPLGERDNFHVTPALLRTPGGELHKERGQWRMVYCGNREDDVEYATSPDGLH